MIFKSKFGRLFKKHSDPMYLTGTPNSVHAIYKYYEVMLKEIQDELGWSHTHTVQEMESAMRYFQKKKGN